MMDGCKGEIRYPVEAPPGPGEALEIAPGVLWMRLPLPTALDHVNVYALDDGAAGWTVIDTGMDTPKARELWEQLLAGPLGGRPVHRQIVTHMHPDHIGLTAWMAGKGAELWCTRTTWLSARMLVLNVEEKHSEHTIDFWRASGMAPEMLARKAAERPFNFIDVVGLPPPSFRRIAEGDWLTVGGRRWLVRCGDGHAPEHATLWSEDGTLVLGGDQLLPSISPNLGVYASEPLADPIAEWLESCNRLAAHATEAQLVLPGHKLPFTGLPLRLRQKAENHHHALERLHAHLATPRVAVDCFGPLFKREVTPEVFGFALAETIAHLNHLYLTGRASRTARADGAWLWRAI
ncbi:MBL fold metallo-hydrolase [Frigidibacter sp. ROC022]|uniref:MBL fold metallo-hydrolase n=1 Tax=Frigidibacter sp. ROC022 TaxID=2971796 RepID=UPI003FCCA5A0